MDDLGRRSYVCRGCRREVGTVVHAAGCVDLHGSLDGVGRRLSDSTFRQFVERYECQYYLELR